MAFYYDKLPKLTLFIVYTAFSVFLFCKVFATSNLVIDEEFHLRQGLNYCNGDFTVWDPKITTLPGLYIVSTLLFLPFNLCNAFTLRLTSLLASIINVWFIYKIRKLVTVKAKNKDWKLAFETFIISTLPPMYFFAHLYYTDIISITAVLGLVLFNMRNEHNIAALFGLASVLMRQTNIVWVGMAFGMTVIDKFCIQTLPFIKDADKTGKIDHLYTLQDIIAVAGFYLKRFYLIPKQLKLLAFYLVGYLLVILAFIGFVLWNGSIVVGDKTAHTAALHLPQILYFSLFTLVFGISMVLTHLERTIKWACKKWYIVAIGTVAMAIIVNFNTIVHPYLLADNRHYTFYVWNKFYGKYAFARYAIIPVYALALISLYHAINNKSAGFKLIFSICAVAAIAFQQLVEVRYFIIPFLLIRLNTSQIKCKNLVVEFFSYTLINAFVFLTFFRKEIYWSDFGEVQRLIW
ncbi:putative Dol-P-Glc:Glc(2)Man(9)GlcNAc(2)-PP-Dol alpha-1,2-glucosyltransferase isoform X1 [Bradysia coprophila]|uniref:putative Dol-P-Glc:Glc(2)Man(9)GlcNAc(2)-PP-Dol alpha-1,2-glucosyltransferase isoform X1 n=1 Tax=Bradysia coprophila TaxID=38358 RepID=UPI00187DC015|nr:putative Dol-P-Glc:Glc(2)Man(9)GlcNAc(2)-PP-Dol alpha-1,2-glucosyltransferase isoform X1 [Bradysia coprophila]